jgi:hypothetical protein
MQFFNEIITARPREFGLKWTTPLWNMFQVFREDASLRDAETTRSGCQDIIRRRGVARTALAGTSAWEAKAFIHQARFPHLVA